MAYELVVSQGRIADRTPGAIPGAALTVEALGKRTGLQPITIGSPSPAKEDDWSASLPEAGETLAGLQAAIAAVHAEAASLEDTDWVQIVGLYDELLRLNPSPVIELNRAVALAMRDGLEAGLQQIDRLLAMGELDGYHLAHAARADLLRRLGRREQAIAAYRQALALAQQGPDRQFLQRRLEELGDP